MKMKYAGIRGPKVSHFSGKLVEGGEEPIPRPLRHALPGSLRGASLLRLRFLRAGRSAHTVPKEAVFLREDEGKELVG
jgi:hypothetical protein